MWDIPTLWSGLVDFQEREEGALGEKKTSDVLFLLGDKHAGRSADKNIFEVWVSSVLLLTFKNRALLYPAQNILRVTAQQRIEEGR